MSVLLPPVANEAEVQVLGALIFSNDCAVDVRPLLTAADFDDPFHAELFRAICKKLDAGQPADLVTLRDSFLKGEDDAHKRTLAIFEAVIDSKHVAAHAGIVADYAQRRRLMEAAQKVSVAAADVHNCKGVEVAQSEALAVLETKTARGAVLVREFVGDVTVEVDRAWNRPAEDHGVRTGLYDLDKLIGGLRPGSVTILAARPSQGKSSFGTTMLARACVDGGIPSALFTVEVSRNDAVRNIACCHAQVDGHALMNASKAGCSDEEFGKFNDALARVREAPLYVDDSPGLTSTSIRASLRKLSSTRGVRFAIIDYLQILSADATSEKSPTREREVARMSANLKLAARESKIPLLVLAQLNREVEHRDGMPRLSDLRESGSIEQDADIVLLLANAVGRKGDAPCPDTGPRGGLVKHIAVAKNRNGPTHPGVEMLLFRAWTRFESIASIYGFPQGALNGHGSNGHGQGEVDSRATGDPGAQPGSVDLAGGEGVPDSSLGGTWNGRQRGVT